VATASSVTIQELSGDRRILELRGPGLPLKGASWEGTQRVVTSWNPGNPVEATQQVLGATEEPSEWEGEWNRTRLGRTPCMFVDEAGSHTRVISPTFLIDVVDDFRIRGSKLRVTWTVVDESGTPRVSKTREGRISKFVVQAMTAYDFTWKLTFAWSGRGGAQQKVVATRDGDLDSAIRGLQATVNDLVGAAERAFLIASKATIAKSANTLSLGQLEQLSKAPLALVQGLLRPVEKATSDLKQLGDIVQTVRALPFSIANAALATAGNAIAVANQFHDRMSRRPAEQNTTRLEVSALTRAAKYFWSTADSSRQVARRGQELRARIASGGKHPNDVTVRRTIEIHVVKQGETLATISQRHYGNPDHAIDIARANRLPWHQTTLPAGRTLVIPLLDSSKGPST
jgi:hypothetical protein